MEPPALPSRLKTPIVPQIHISIVFASIASSADLESYIEGGSERNGVLGQRAFVHWTLKLPHFHLPFGSVISHYKEWLRSTPPLGLHAVVGPLDGLQNDQITFFRPSGC